ncbi:MAG: hypothetical protein AAB034_05980, partial [Nitrospirota bacterium]
LRLAFRRRTEHATTVSDELDVLKVVTARLEAGGVPYMVTGSMAANFYTTPRMTRDIDLVVELCDRDISHVVSLFQDDYYIDREMVEQAVRNQSMFNMIHNALVVKVDCVVRKDSEYRREEFARRRPVSIAGQPVCIVSPEDLILSKLDWAKDSRSQLQLDDVRNLLGSVQGLDIAYLIRWADRLGLSSLYREVSA